MDAAPHVRLQAKLAAAEAAVQALLTECQQPDVVATLEVRARAVRRAARGRDARLAHTDARTTRDSVTHAADNKARARSRRVAGL